MLMAPVFKSLASGLATIMLAAGGWIWAQTDSLWDKPLETVGGGVLVTAAVTGFVIILRAGAFQSKSATTIIGRLETRVTDLEADLEMERKRSARLLLALDKERELRMSLEARGLSDRRHRIRSTDMLVHPKDYAELADELLLPSEDPEPEPEPQAEEDTP